VVDQAQASYQSAVLTALQEVEDALVQLQGDKERLVRLRAAKQRHAMPRCWPTSATRAG
jgi:outer membrane protein TolC